MSDGRRNERRDAALSVLLLAVFVGLAAGVLEAAVLAFRRWGLGMRVHLSADFLWMTPLADLLIVSALALPLAALVFLLPNRVRPSHAAGVLAAAGAASVLLNFPQLQGYAKWVLILGVGVQAARVAGRDPGRSRRVTRFGAAALAAAVLVVALGREAQLRLAERNRSERPAVASADAPNILLLILDTVRAKSLSLYGAPWSTSPTIDRLAAEGVAFDLAIAPTSWTLPSHATLFTGRYPHELDAGWEQALGPSAPTLAETLSERGYRTAGFTANLAYTSWETGLQRGFDRYVDHPRSLGQVVLSSGLGRRISRNGWLRQRFGFYDNLNRVPAGEINQRLRDWVAETGDERPFFAFLNYFDAHEPYLPEPPYATAFGPDSLRKNHLIRQHPVLGGGYRPWRNRMTPAEQLAEERAYAALIRQVDDRIAELVDWLRETGRLERTLIVVTADHGEHFGEHDKYGHGNSLYTQNIRVPLVFWMPGVIPAGARVPRPVSLRDVPSTVLDLVSAEELLPGTSLRPLWGAEAADAGASAVLSVLEPKPRSDDRRLTSIVQDSLHFLFDGDDHVEVYDLVRDADEERDLGGEAALGPRVARARAGLDALLRQPDAMADAAAAPAATGSETTGGEAATL